MGRWVHVWMMDRWKEDDGSRDGWWMNWWLSEWMEGCRMNRQKDYRYMDRQMV